MQSSGSFDLVLQNKNNINKYLLLSYTWQGMIIEHKTAAVDILKNHKGNFWGVDYCRKIDDSVSVLFPDLHNFQPGIFLSMEELSHRTRGYEDLHQPLDNCR